MAKLGPDHLSRLPSRWVDALAEVETIRAMNSQTRRVGLAAAEGHLESAIQRRDDLEQRLRSAMGPTSPERDAIGMSRSSFAHLVDQEMLRSITRTARKRAVRDAVMNMGRDARTVVAEEDGAPD